MIDSVNGNLDRRAARRTDTEERIAAAAARLFLRDGWAATTLSAVAREAGVADRTVYVRFGTKADLLKRTVDIALFGDALPIPLADRDWVTTSMTAPSFAERAAAMAAGSALVVGRLAGLIGVSQEAVAEPVVANAAQAGRQATVAQVRRWWESALRDGLLEPDTDLEWLVQTSGTLSHAETYLIMIRTLEWSPERHREWLQRTLVRLARAAAPSGALPEDPP